MKIVQVNLKLNAMKILYATLLFGFLYSCAVTQDGVIINVPTAPQVNLCQNVATDTEAQQMAEQIKDQAFPDERLARARMITNNHCFVSSQVVTVITAFTFEDNRLTMAKELYRQTTDRSNYHLVIDSFAFKSDRDELTAYIQNNP